MVEDQKASGPSTGDDLGGSDLSDTSRPDNHRPDNHQPDYDPAIGDLLFAVVDVETSGLNDRRHRVLQVAVVTATADGTIVDQWASYLRPRWPLFRLGPKRIHGIDRSTLRGAPPATAVIDELLGRLDGKVLTAHNLRFDRSFLAATAARLGRLLTPGPELCTLLLSRSLDPERTYSHGLASLCARHSIPLAGHHDALVDATSTAALLPHLLPAAGVTRRSDLAAFNARRGADPQR